MTQTLYESCDAEWHDGPLYRDLILTDSPELAAFVKYYRPSHVAVAAIKPEMEEDVDVEYIRALLNIITSSRRLRRYARVILTTTDERQVYDEVIRYIASHFAIVLEERRVFYTIVRPFKSEVDKMLRALGAAEAVRRSPEGGWQVPKIL